jgi:uncharacterized protein YdhG (YjbR/CyaY superfamily)
LKSDRTAPRNIDEYIADFPDDVQRALNRVRKTIRKAAPDAQETISYRIPAFTLEGYLVYFAAWKNHIGFYPASAGITKFKKELSKYQMAKGSVRFPLDEPIPLDLIGRIVKFRAGENLQRAAAKSGKKAGNRQRRRASQ